MCLEGQVYLPPLAPESESGGEVDVHDLLPLHSVILLYGKSIADDACVVDQPVKATVAFYRGVNHAPDCAFFGYIASNHGEFRVAREATGGRAGR